ncbi:MAG: VWA domain-containing protein [Betaproteobacteria bacterium]|nr:VWA domain-containing protein [Betaproteobacteria bacterium]
MAGRLAENVLHFARILRAAGIPIGTDKVIEASRALALAGVERRADWHATLAALFLTRHEQQAAFDQAFDVFWRDPALEEKMMGLLLPKARGRTPAPEADVSTRVAQALLPARARPPREDAPDEVTIDATLTFSPGERLRRLDFEQMTAAEWNEARAFIRRLELPVPRIATRRYEPSPAGGTPDLRAALRRLARDGGELVRLPRRRRREAAPPLVVLCDISGSMHRYTRMFLHFLHALVRDRSRVHAFLFGTRLTHVTRPLRGRDVDQAVKRVCDAVPDWAGGTRIGACLREFNWRWSRRVLGQNACVILLTDGLERDDTDGLGEETARLARACHRLVWLNPLLRFDGFEPTASGIRAMRPHVDAFRPMHNIHTLTDFARALSHPESSRRAA